MRAVRRLFLVLSALAIALTGFAVGSPVVAPAAAAQAAAPGGVYTPLATPRRILDTRTTIGGHHRKIAPDETVALAVPGLPADATAVVVNLTGVGGAEATFLSLFPDRFAGTSTLNLVPGQTAAAGAFVGLGADRKIRVMNSRGQVDAVVDLVGYLARGSGAGFASTSATRILDTRSALGGHPRTLAPGETMTLPVRGVAGVPADATAVLLNVTGVAPTIATYLGATPDGQSGTSTVNLDSGITRANVTVTGIGGDGAVRITNSRGNTHALVDVLGWFGPSANGRYVPLADPKRVLDTRGTPEGPLAAGASRRTDFRGAALPDFGNLVTLFALTAVQPTARTYLTASDPRWDRPPVSTVSVEAGAVVPNLSVVSGTAADVYNSAGSVHALVDAYGYFYTPTRPNPTVPGAVTFNQVRHTGTAVTLSWHWPDDGGLPLTQYAVTLQPGGRRVVVPSATRSVSVDGLTMGVRYTITAVATNLAGDGPVSAPVRIGPPSWLTRVDTSATGEVDPDLRVDLRGISADGRYLLWAAMSHSVLVPAPYRTPENRGVYHLRKDLQTGAIELLNLGADGQPVVSAWSALGADNRTFAFSTRDGIVVRDLVTGDVRTVTEDVATPVLSGDGRWMYWRVSIQGAGSTLYRHDLLANRTETLLACPTPATGCYLASGPQVSDDGATVLFDYRATPATPMQEPTLFDPNTRELRAVTGDDAGAAVLSGDGAWVYYRCDDCSAYTINKVATTPGALPVRARHWPAGMTWTMSPHATTTDGRMLGYFRQRGDGDWYSTAPGLILDMVDGREAMLPQPRHNSYLGRPLLSADGSVAVAREDCLSLQECGPVGYYALPVSDLLNE